MRALFRQRSPLALLLACLLSPHLLAPHNSADGIETCCSDDTAALIREAPATCMDVPITLGGDAHSSPAALLRCINGANHTLSRRALSQLWVDDVARVRAVAAWWSNKPPTVPVTVVTQLSITRLHQLWAQCRSWKGPLSAAVYVPSPPDGSAQKQLGCAMQQAYAVFLAAWQDPEACDLDIILLHEHMPDEPPGEHMLAPQYPVNVLRNMARLQARTEVLALIDVDMLMSRQLLDWLQAPNQTEGMLRLSREKNAFVMPAFEVEGDNFTLAAQLADTYAGQPKAALLKGIEQKVVTSFALARYPLGHNQTNFSRWETSTEPYEVGYARGFEPWVMIHRTLSPWHDARYRGYGLNKIAHIAHLAASNFTFMVHPSAFIVHRAHAKSSSRRQFNADMVAYYAGDHKKNITEKRANLYFRVHHLFAVMKNQMDKGPQHFSPVLDPATDNCRLCLAWWR